MLYEKGDIIKVISTITEVEQFICILDILVEKQINHNTLRKYRYYNIGNGDISAGLLMNSDGSILKYELHWRASD